MNKVILQGRLSHDPELRTTQSNISKTTFTIAVNRKTKNDEVKYDVDFIDCVSWRTTADVIYKHFHKGDSILIEGSLRKDTYQKDGVNKYNNYVLVDGFDFVGTQKETQNIGNESLTTDEIVLDDLSLPF